MNLFDRIVLTLYTLCLALLSIALFVVFLGIIPNKYLFFILDKVYNRWEYSIIALIFFLVSIRFLISGVKSQRGKVITKTTEMGEISISLSTIESLVERVASQNPSIKDLRTRVRKKDDQVYLFLKVTVLPDTVIPDTISKLQKSVKEYVENISGIKVLDVDVSVTNLSSVTKTKIEWQVKRGEK